MLAYHNRFAYCTIPPHTSIGRRRDHCKECVDLACPSLVLPVQSRSRHIVSLSTSRDPPWFFVSSRAESTLRCMGNAAYILDDLALNDIAEEVRRSCDVHFPSAGYAQPYSGLSDETERGQLCIDDHTIDRRWRRRSSWSYRCAFIFYRNGYRCLDRQP